MANEEAFPRDLKAWERELLLWTLPEDRSGYREYRRNVENWKVLAQGRRGAGNYILGPPEEPPDNESPLPQVFSYGVIETKGGSVSVTVRERLGNQIEFELAVLGRGELFVPVDIQRQWTFSTWFPGSACPACGSTLREVEMKAGVRRLVLALCRNDERLWVLDSESGVNHPIPVTNFYNELMFHKRIRDPKIAFSSRRLFQHLNEFTDSDLTAAFSSYNMIRTKVHLEAGINIPRTRKSMIQRIRAVLKGKSS